MASILIIQQRDVVRAFFREILERAGHEVLEASLGMEGIAQYRLFTTDMVLTDIHFSDARDLEIIVRLREEFPAVKILAVSASAGKTDMLLMAEVLGADVIVRDALDGEALLDAVGGLLGTP